MRMIDQVQKMLSTKDLNVAKLKQKKQALRAKIELLNKLDEEIVHADGLDEQFEQADIVREQIDGTTAKP